MNRDMLKGAIIDPTGQYRYTLWRICNHDLPMVLFIMLNPSTADENVDDATIRRCIGFAKAWGYGSLEVVNLFAYRATDPRQLKVANDPVGPDNDAYILREASRADRIILAWGTNGTLLGRNRKVYSLVARYKPECIDISLDGHPKHPLYLSANQEPFVYPKEAIS